MTKIQINILIKKNEMVLLTSLIIIGLKEKQFKKKKKR